MYLEFLGLKNANLPKFDRLLVVFISFIIVVNFCTGKYVVDDNLTQNTNQYLHLQHQAYLDAWVFKNVS